MIYITAPAKEVGQVFLKVDKEMWNYVPTISRMIKIPPSMMMQSWMGSDFTNDDLVKQTTLTEEYDLALVETVDHYTITLTPQSQTVTVWGKIDYVIDKTNLVPVSQRFYDDNNVMVRHLEFSELRDYSGRLLPSRLEMIPLNKPGHKTLVIYESLNFEPIDVNDSDFTLRNLQSRF